MDKTKKYYGVIIFCIVIVVLLFGAYKFIAPRVQKSFAVKQEVIAREGEVAVLKQKRDIVQGKIKRIKDSMISAQKKIYSPIESDLGDETLFFTLYNDVIEMLHANSVKIKAIDYKYNPETDNFVKSGKDVYFVCDVNMELVSNYVNLGKLIQDLYQYPYYIRINELEVKPYEKDKKILISNLSLRLYAHTVPEDTETKDVASPAPARDGANMALPQ